MRRQIATLTLAAAALTATTTLAPSAQAEETPTYTCDVVRTDNYGGVGITDCVASNGAPTSGPIYDTFILKGRKGIKKTLTCYKPENSRDPSGTAKDYPKWVHGDSCQ